MLSFFDLLNIYSLGFFFWLFLLRDSYSYMANDCLEHISACDNSLQGACYFRCLLHISKNLVKLLSLIQYWNKIVQITKPLEEYCFENGCSPKISFSQVYISEKTFSLQWVSFYEYSDRPVSIAQELSKLRDLLVRIRSIEYGYSGLFKHVGSIMFLISKLSQKSFIQLFSGATLKSPMIIWFS